MMEAIKTANPLVIAFRVELLGDSNLSAYEKGDVLEVLMARQSQKLLHHEDLMGASSRSWSVALKRLVDNILDKARKDEEKLFSPARFSLLAMACLDAFLQANVTGPPLTWRPAEICLPRNLQDSKSKTLLHQYLTNSLSVDGEAVYRRIPHVELFCLARDIANHDAVVSDNAASRWSRLRVNSWHQRLLSESAPSLQDKIGEDLVYLSNLMSIDSSFPSEEKAQFLLERASIEMLQGDDRRAREHLKAAADVTGLQYVLTGRLGKRTKFQTFDTSQLVVLAKSSSGKDSGKRPEKPPSESHEKRPDTVELNDDTLLDKISFVKPGADEDPKIEENIPKGLQDVDPANQPILKPLDSINILALASSITNTSPDSGLTREETLPYAIRVLEGGSSNWQIYSQALLVRSRIETYRSRTVERGVLQMQTLVDQVIAETTEGNKLPSDEDANGGSSVTTFLPRANASESASSFERLQYIHSLASPTRWAIEAELAEKWVSIGGLRTALEIFERLEMWAETALCLASLEDEAKAREMIMAQLYENQDAKKEKDPLPNDAPRLFCILGDIDNDQAMYERSWEISNRRYSRAQRSLGKMYLKARDLEKADKAFSASLAIHPQNSSAWFSLGCVRLELKSWRTAVEAFTRVVQREQDDAEAWSNLAAALMRVPPEEDIPGPIAADEEQTGHSTNTDPQKHVKQAFVAFKKAAALKRESSRIWQNILNVAATISPPPYSDIIMAQTRIVELLGSAEGEGCLDVEILEGLLNHIIQTSQLTRSTSSNGNSVREDSGAPRQRFGLERMFLELMNKKAVPLITHSRRLWLLVAKLNVYLDKPSAALDAYEKAWRVTLNRPGWDNESGIALTNGSSSDPKKAGKEEDEPEKVWRAVVDSTIDLADAYESLGEKEVTEGLKAGSGELVCKNWKQKTRMAIRSVTGRRSKAGLEGMDELQERMEQLRSS